MAQAVYGGEMRFRYDGQNQIVVRADPSVMPTGSTSESVTNQNGSIVKVSTLRPYQFAATFEDSDVDGNPIDWDAVVTATDIDATFLEDYTGTTYTLTGGHFVGDIAVNRVNGEVTGLAFDARRMTKRTNA